MGKNSARGAAVLVQAVVELRTACTRIAGLLALFFTTKMKKKIIYQHCYIWYEDEEPISCSAEKNFWWVTLIYIL